MTTPGILMVTLLVVALVLALALLAGSLALLVTAGDSKIGHHSGLRQSLHELDRQWRIERWVYRHHRVFGLLVVMIALTCIWQLSHLQFFAASAATEPWALLAWLLAGGQVVNLIIGILIITRPSLLKPLEDLSNRWHRITAFDAGSRLPARLRALLLVVVALVVALTSGWLLLRQLAL